MIGKEFEHFLRTNDSSPSFVRLKGGIYHGLAWEEASALDASSIVFEEINGEIGDHILRLKDYLKLPSTPDILLTKAWSELPFAKQILSREIIADAFFDIDIPERGVIRLSPNYLKSIVDKKMGRSEELPLPLSLVLGHESFHLYQFIHYPKQIGEDIVEMRKSLDKWNITKTENQAREFEKHWLENWHHF